jgi:hypothetical protein
MPRLSYFQQIAGGTAPTTRLAPAYVPFPTLGLPSDLPSEPITEILATPPADIVPVESKPARTFSEPAQKFEPSRPDPVRRPDRVEETPISVTPVLADAPKPPSHPVVEPLPRLDRVEQPSRSAPAPQPSVSVAAQSRPATERPMAAPAEPRPRPLELLPPRAGAEREDGSPAAAEGLAISPARLQPKDSPFPLTMPRAEAAPGSPARTAYPVLDRFAEAPPASRPMLDAKEPPPRSSAVTFVTESGTSRPIKAGSPQGSEEPWGSPTPIRLEPPAIASRPDRPSPDQPTAGLRIGSIEVRIAPPAAQAPASQPAASIGRLARPAATRPVPTRLARGFRSFGLVQG